MAFLGPAGTFHEQALLTQPDLAACERLPMTSIAEALDAVDDGRADLGFVAIENSIEGGVNMTVDTLAFDLELLIQREVIMAVELCLIAPRGVGLGDIERVVSFPHAIAQCHKYLARQLPSVSFEAADSTAGAARALAENGGSNTAAIGPRRAAEAYGLEVLTSDIEDHPDNHTRFVLVAREGIPKPTGHDKSTIITFQRANRPGSLVNILQEFSARAINLTYLQSRPTKRELGDYCFVIDLEGHVADERVADCLKSVHANQAQVRFVGSYPAADANASTSRRDASEAWASAEAWLAGIRSDIR